MKKDFKDTKFAGFLDKAKKLVPEIADVGLDILTGTSPIKAIAEKLAEAGESGNAEIKGLETEARSLEIEFQREIANLEFKDRESARTREIRVAESGKSDFMFYIVGLTGLLIFVFIVVVLFFIDIPERSRELVIHLLGVVEGVVVSIFSYYFGSSKGSKDKTQILKNPNT